MTIGFVDLVFTHRKMYILEKCILDMIERINTFFSIPYIICILIINYNTYYNYCLFYITAPSNYNCGTPIQNYVQLKNVLKNSTNKFKKVFALIFQKNDVQKFAKRIIKKYTKLQYNINRCQNICYLYHYLFVCACVKMLSSVAQVKAKPIVMQKYL